MIRNKILRVDEEFAKELEDLKINRIKSGKDHKLKSDRRLTAAIRRHRLWPTIRDDILLSELKEDS